MVDTTLNITYGGAPAVVEFKELNYGEMKEIIRKLGLNKTKTVGDKVEMPEIDWTVLIDEALVKSVVKAPFPITIEGIASLPPATVTALAKKALEVNPFQLGF